ncbi:hypothetical protein [Pedobacter agri]|uniref:Uncharacterized protein n=1 Tax=Pedobacter agri TaxID=454586 RepID=A0A9X3I9Q0_9SPHI|nr:hypothetical protein [Pedobacter agri]MCX3264778.1 hypothetical protein [Pedobacter agri]
MFEQNQETKNAVVAIDAIKRMGVAATTSEIAKSIDYPKSNVNAIKKSSRNMPIKYLTTLILKYHINPEFIFKNSLPIFDPKGPFDKYNNLADPTNQDINERLDRIEQNQAKILELLTKLTQK